MNAKVRTDGRIAMALIGEVMAAGKHPSGLARELEGRLREFVVSPRVTINVEAVPTVRSPRLGEVAHPGALALEPPADLLQAMALLGGPTEFADKSRIFVVRRFPEFKRIRFNYARSREIRVALRCSRCAQATRSSSSSTLRSARSRLALVLALFVTEHARAM